MIAIQTKALTKRFKNKIAVDSLNLQINEGELFSLLGVNGAGKTTTIRMLSCLLTPDSGDAFVLGHSVVHAPELIKKQMNLSPQETAVAPNLTVTENLVLIGTLYGMTMSRAKEQAQSLISLLCLNDVTKSKAKVLSGGMKRRLSIAMALITEPKVLFLDEPTLGLDVIARRELWKLVESLKGKTTIILTTHYLEEAEALSDRIGIMASGKLTAVGTVEELNRRAGKEKLEDTFISLATGGNL